MNAHERVNRLSKRLGADIPHQRVGDEVISPMIALLEAIVDKLDALEKKPQGSN